MIIKMMLDAAVPEEKPLVRSFVKHLLGGFGTGVAVGAFGLALVLFLIGHKEMGIPPLFYLAMMLQMGAMGGLVGAGVFMSRITDRSGDNEDKPLEDDQPLTG